MCIRDRIYPQRHSGQVMHRSQVFCLLHTASATIIFPIVHAVRKVQHSRSWSLFIVLSPPHAIAHEKKAHKALFLFFSAFGQDHTCAHCSSTPNVRSPRATSFLYVLQSQPRRKNASRVTCTHVRSSLVHDVINLFKHRSP